MNTSAETIQLLADRAAAQQTQSDRVLAARRAGDAAAAHFLELPADQRDGLLYNQSIADGLAALHAGDMTAAADAFTSAIARVGSRRPRRKVR